MRKIQKMINNITVKIVKNCKNTKYEIGIF